MTQSISQRLAELNTRILDLEVERSTLLAQELQEAQARAEEVSKFIGVYAASSGLDAPSLPTRTAGKKGVLASKEESGKDKQSPRTKEDSTEEEAGLEEEIISRESFITRSPR